MNNICCLVLNYNDSETAISLISRIKGYNVFSTILVVDNCSTDESFDRLSSYSNASNYKVIKTDCNGGYGYGNNYGINYAYHVLKAEYVLLCNPDVSFEEAVVTRLASVLDENQDCIIASAVQHDINNLEIFDKAWMIPSAFKYACSFSNQGNKRITKKYYESSYFEEKEVIVDCVPGAMLMIRAKYFIELGGYDESIFLYCEEEMIGYKAKKMGFKTILATDCFYQHEHGTSINKSIKDEEKQKNMIIENKLYFMKNYLKANFFEMSIAHIILFLKPFYLVLKHLILMVLGK